MNTVQGLSVLVFIVVFILIAVEAIHRTYAALSGAIIFVLIGAVTPEELIHFIDIEILTVVLGLFLLVEGSERSGLFQYLAIKIMRSSRSPTAFAMILLTFTIILAVFVSNIGAMLIMANITITMARSLKIRPQMLLIFQAVVINVGGMTLWMGSIPNIIIGLEGGLSFMDFIINVLPLGIILYLVTLVIFTRLFKGDFTPEPEAEFRELEFDEWIERAIEVSGLQMVELDLKSGIAAIIMILTVLGFIIYEDLGLTPAFIALTGGIFMMMLQVGEPTGILREIDWSTILFLGGLFIMINGLENIGVITVLAQGLSNLIGKVPIRASIILMWLSGIVSSIVDNIPLSSSIAPIIKDLVLDESWKVLWWGVVVGANLGGSMTPIGSPTGIITIGISEQEGYPISFNQFLRLGLGLSLIYFIISMFYFVLRYGIFAI